jgi:hypothetical protein
MTWGRLRWAVGSAVAALGVVGACGYPNFTYGSGAGGNDATSSSVTLAGGGGHGGATISSTREAVTIAPASSSSSSSSTGMGGGPIAQVPCIDGHMCAPGKICCFNYADGTCDECLDLTGACGTDQDPSCGGPSNYARYNCNTNDDCNQAEGQVCCEDLACDQGVVVATSMVCSTVCMTGTGRRIACAIDADCPGSQTCQSVSFDYPGYGYCGSLALCP